MFADDRVNNGQSHSLDVILIITFLLDIARQVTNFEVCADTEVHNQNKLFMFCPYGRWARIGPGRPTTEDFSFLQEDVHAEPQFLCKEAGNNA